MLKSAIHSITAPGPAVENLAVDGGQERAKRSKSVQKSKREKVRRIHPMVEVAMRHKIASELPIEPIYSLQKKTNVESLPIDRLSALTRRSDSGIGVTMSNDQANATGKGGDATNRNVQNFTSNRKAVSSLYQAKAAALSRAEILAALYPYGLSKAAAEAVSRVLLKAASAIEGVGNAPELKPPTMRKAIPERGRGGTRMPNGTSDIANMKPVFSTQPFSFASGGSTLPKLAEHAPLSKAAALVQLTKTGLHKTAVLDFLRVSQDKKAALLTIGRLKQASEQERAWAKLAGLMRTYELTHSDGKGAMPSGPKGPVPTVPETGDNQLAADWCNRLDPFERKVPLARVMGRRKGNL